MKYRSDISGLRALAVVPVVLYHLNPALVPGGYVGVDIFFVISGYLITSILAKDLGEGHFSLLRFYDRRIRRIVPAYFAMALLTAIAALVLLPPDLLVGFGESLRSASIFFANRYFLSVTHYFGATPDTQFLLHTWSLSVEEQFYLAWPLVLAVLFHPRLARVRPFVVYALLAASLFIATRNVVDRPLAAFYNANGRFWELLLGAVLALGLVPPVRGRWVPEAMAGVGLAMILAALALFDHHTVFPGLSALVPTIGALLLLWAGEQGRSTIVGRLLSFAPFAGIGLISYSLYLWHWPILAVYRYLTLGVQPGLVREALLLAVMVVVSILSWRFIEAPFRRHGPSNARSEWISVGVGLVALGMLVALAWVMIATNGLPGRTSAAFLKAQTLAAEPWRGQKSCLLAPRPDVPCRFGDMDPQAPLIVLWGDSFADHHAPALDALGREDKFGLLQLTKAGCAPEAPDPALGSMVTGETRACNAFRANALEQILSEPRVQLVIIGGNWPGGAALEPSMQKLQTAVDRIAAAGKPVVLVATAGQFSLGGGRCLLRFRFLGLDESWCNETRATSDAVALPLEKSLRAIADGRPGVSVFLPRALFCDAQACRPSSTDGLPLFRDNGHLNLSGSFLTIPAWRDFLAGVRGHMVR